MSLHCGKVPEGLDWLRDYQILEYQLLFLRRLLCINSINRGRKRKAYCLQENVNYPN